MRAIAFALSALTAGCTPVQYGGNVNGATVHVNSGNALGAVLLGGMLTAAAVEDFREPPSALPLVVTLAPNSGMAVLDDE